MSNTKYKKLCLVKCVIEDVKGISIGKTYKCYGKHLSNVCIYNDYGIKFWYNEKYFREVKSNEEK